jgi:diketogulonate reductase-like aldo/keto reductase
MPTRRVPLPGGASMPALGLGTWRMGESAATRAAEVAAVRLALELGYRLFDTAEMYGEGGAEEVLGQALHEAGVARDEVFLVSKVYPHNASRRGTVAACERSLQRLRLVRIDLYLLHWRGSHPLAETVAAMRELQDRGNIVHWGVSNFDTDDLRELAAAGGGCAANQVYFSLSERGAQFELLPWMRGQHMPLMAYCPIDQGALAGEPLLAEIGRAHGASAAQVALAWVLAQAGVVAIPKAVKERHLRENLAACDLTLSADELVRIDARFPPPRRKTALAMS